MSKKVIGALLALVMALSVFSLTVFAVGQISDESTTDAAKYTQTWSLSTPVQVGDSYQVKVYLKTNYPVGPVQFKLNNVSGASVELGSGYYTGSNFSCSPSGLVILTPSTKATLVGETFETAREIAVVTYTKGSADPAIDNSPKTIANPTGTLYAARLSGSTAVNSANLVLGQTVVIDGQTPTPPAGGTADLALTSTATSAGVVIDTNKKFGNAYDGVVYGIPFKADGTALKAADYEAYLTATNGGSLVYVKTPYVVRPASYGTGTTVQVKNADGSVAKTYVIVIFGDVDGSGALAAKDIQLGVAEVMNPTLTEVQKLAANCYGLPRGSQTNIIASYYTIDAGDLKAMCTQVMSGNGYNFATLAEKHALYNTYYQ